MNGELPAGLKPVFDYGSINSDHMAAATEICDLIRNSGNEVLANAISQRFKLVEHVKFDHTATDFARACATAGVFLTIQGYVTNHDDPEKIHYPIISITEDVRNLQALVDAIKLMGSTTTLEN